MNTQLNDHDLLIELNVKLSQLSLDLKYLGDGTTIRIVKVEQRQDIVDKVILESKPEESIKMLHRHEDWIKEFQRTWKFVVALIGLVGLIIGAIVGSFNIFDFLRK